MPIDVEKEWVGQMNEWLFQLAGAVFVGAFIAAVVALVTSPISLPLYFHVRARTRRRQEEERERTRLAREHAWLVEQRRREALTPEERAQEDADREAERERRQADAARAREEADLQERIRQAKIRQRRLKPACTCKPAVRGYYNNILETGDSGGHWWHCATRQ